MKESLVSKKEGAPKSPPKGYPKDKKLYGDSVNYKYPLDTYKHVRAAICYFSMPKNRKQYTHEEVATIWARIKKAAKKFGINIEEELSINEIKEKYESLDGGEIMSGEKDENKDEAEEVKDSKNVPDTKVEETDKTNTEVKEESKTDKKEESLNEDNKIVEKEKPEEKPEKETENPEKEPKETKKEKLKEESLMKVISEAKESLSSAVVENDRLTKEVLETKSELESLQSESKELKVQKESLIAELNKYKKAEQLRKDEIRKAKLESLSKSFAKSGKEISIESLDKFSDESLAELEKIVSDLKPEKLTQPAGTVKKESLNKLASPIRKESLQLKDNNFFTDLCNKLASEQNESASGKRVTIM